MKAPSSSSFKGGNSMILKMKDLTIDVDKISCIAKTENEENYGICLDGGWLTVSGSQAKAVRKAYNWLHKSHMYDKSMKKIK